MYVYVARCTKINLQIPTHVKAKNHYSTWTFKSVETLARISAVSPPQVEERAHSSIRTHNRILKNKIPKKKIQMYSHPCFFLSFCWLDPPRSPSCTIAPSNFNLPLIPMSFSFLPAFSRTLPIGRRIRGCLHDTGATFGASSLRFPLMALYLFTWYHHKILCRRESPRREFTPVLAPGKEFHSGTKSRNGIM